MTIPKPIACVYNGRPGWKLDLRGIGMNRVYRRTRGEINDWIVNNSLTIQKFGSRGVMADSEYAYLLQCREEAAKAGVDILESIRFYVEHGKLLVQKTLDDASAEFMLVKDERNVRPNYRNMLDWLTGLLVKHFGPDRLVSSITLDDLKGWLATRQWNRVTRRANLHTISTFFNYCKRLRWIAHNPLHDMEWPIIEHRKPVILTMDQCKALLNAALKDPPLLPYLALQLFGGLRRTEVMERLKPEHIKSDYIDLEECVSKTREQRFVPINDTLRQWLAIHPFEPVLRIHHRWAEVRKAIEWKQQNLIRHTAATMLFHRYGPTEATQMLGHSEQYLFRHYKGALADPDDAGRFWALTPVFGLDRKTVSI